MKLKEYLSHLKKAVDADNSLLDMELVYAIDDEGNDFRQVNFLPTLGIFKQGEFISKDEIEEYNENYETEYSDNDINSLCIN